MSATARELIRRRRERMTLESLQGLVVHLGGFGEERKAVLAVSEGWILYGRDSQVPMPTMSGLSRLDPEMSRCESDRAVLAQEDHGLDFRRMLNDANRANVSFYPMDPRGLVAFDTPISEEPVSVVTDLARLRNRLDSLRTMADATDGVAIVDSNDLDRGLRRVVDDLKFLLPARLLLEQSARRTAVYRTIKVKVKRSGVDVRHRRGYRAATKADMAEIASVTAAKSSPPSPVASAVASLGRVRNDAVVQARASYTWTAAADGSVSPVIWFVGEWDATVASTRRPVEGGADVTIAVTAPDKASLENSKQTLTRETRGFVLRVPVPAGQSAGDYSLRVTTKPVGVSLGSTETLHVVLPEWPKAGAIAVGQPQLFRRGPYTGTTFVAAADLRFRRQERLKVEVGVLGPMTSGEVRLLDRAGNLLGVPVVSATRDENGGEGGVGRGGARAARRRRLRPRNDDHPGGHDAEGAGGVQDRSIALRRRHAQARVVVAGVPLTAAGAVSLFSQAQPPAAPAAQQPTFRTGVNYVRADVYPTTDGQIVRDLRPEEFELREDGALQKLDSVRFVDPGRLRRRRSAWSRTRWPSPARRPPIPARGCSSSSSTPTTSTGPASYKAHLAFVEMLGQGMGEHDLVGVMTPEMSAASVTFGRRTTVIEEVLQRHFDLSRTPDASTSIPRTGCTRLLRSGRSGGGDGLAAGTRR